VNITLSEVNALHPIPPENQFTFSLGKYLATQFDDELQKSYAGSVKNTVLPAVCVNEESTVSNVSLVIAVTVLEPIFVLIFAPTLHSVVNKVPVPVTAVPDAPTVPVPVNSAVPTIFVDFPRYIFVPS
jgi:hypothetical protein